MIWYDDNDKGLGIKGFILQLYLFTSHSLKSLYYKENTWNTDLETEIGSLHWKLIANELVPPVNTQVRIAHFNWWMWT